jgi:hypothetical protein
MKSAMGEKEWEEYIRKRAKESVINQAIDAVLERYYYKRSRLKAMPRGTTCAGCPYWDDIEMRCRGLPCDAERVEPDWEKLAKEEQQAVKNVRSYLEQVLN